MKKKRTKKYPIFTYLCYLLAVAALVTSVTFARYSVATSGSVSTQVALYNCSYEIDGFSSFAFNNSSFYIRDDGNNLIGNTTARTVRFTMRNYTPMEDPTQQKATATDVNVQGSIRLRVPAELGDKLAIQLTDATAAGASSTVVTPQIVLGELLYAEINDNGEIVTHEVTVGTDDEGNAIKQNVITTDTTKYANFGNPTTLETENFSNYEERTNNDEALDQSWTVSGGLTTTDGVTKGAINIVQNVDEGTGLNMTITAETDEEPETYSVGFRRSAGTSLFLDLSKKMTYYTIEISLPSMLLTGGDIDHCTHVAYLSLVNRLANSVYWYNLMTDGKGDPQTEPISVDTDGDGTDDGIITGYLVNDENGRVYESGDNSGDNGTIYYITEDNLVYNADGKVITNMDQLITDPPSSQNEGYYIDRGAQGISTAAGTEDIKVLGYHFEQSVPVEGSTTNQTTNVRVNCAYDYQADENGNGTYTVTLDHVAPIEADAANYIHGITWVNNEGNTVGSLTGITYRQNATPFNDITGKCSNSETNNINLSSVTIDPLGVVQGGTYTSNAVQMAVNRSFTLSMKAAFVQASTLPGS